MSDPLDPLLPPGERTQTEAKSFEELRREYRAENLKRVRAMTRPDDLVMKDKDGTELSRISTGFRTTRPAGQDHQRLDEYLVAGGEVPSPGDTTFTTLPVPAAKLEDLAGNAEGVLRGEQVRHAGNPTGDAPREGPDLASLDEQAVLDWTERNVVREVGPGELHPHLGGNDATPKDTRPRKIRIKRESRTNDPASGPQDEQGAVPAGDQPQDRGAGSGEGASQGPLNPEYIRSEGSAQDTEAFNQFWDEFKRTGHAGALPPGTTISIPPDIAYDGSPGNKIWFAGRGPFRFGPRSGTGPADSPAPLSSPAQWGRVLAEAVRRFVQLCWDCCRQAITRRGSDK